MHTYTFREELLGPVWLMPSLPLFASDLDGNNEKVESNDLDDNDEEVESNKKLSTCFNLNLYPNLEGILSKDWTYY